MQGPANKRGVWEKSSTEYLGLGTSRLRSRECVTTVPPPKRVGRRSAQSPAFWQRRLAPDQHISIVAPGFDLAPFRPSIRPAVLPAGNRIRNFYFVDAYLEAYPRHK